ncbi:hypothetical protein CEXT_288381 [Caerostris extrusa]|uniref:Uncharacterized protein n=1 Tax=Caerostris extrusa TaxID=172846 RepID=A0AAV4MPH5_CAEEX|nr:hypothetical protein CEXT_288381 [Caerostris extrusa]
MRQLLFIFSFSYGNFNFLENFSEEKKKKESGKVFDEWGRVILRAQCAGAPICTAAVSFHGDGESFFPATNALAGKCQSKYPNNPAFIVGIPLLFKCLLPK